MDIRFYETFIALVKTKHFGQTAQHMHISQSTVSSRIKQLEIYYDTSLFFRIRNNVTLTSAGERLVEYAELITSTSIKAKLELSLEKGKTCQLKLAGTPNVWDVYLHSALSQATNEFKKYSFIAEFQSNEQLKSNVLHGTLDIAFTFEPIIGNGILSIKVSNIALGLVHTKNWTGITNSRYIYVDWGAKFAMAQNSLLGESIIPSMRTSSSCIARNYMMRNEAAAYLPLKGMLPKIGSSEFTQDALMKVWQQPLYLNYAESNLFDDVITFFKEIAAN